MYDGPITALLALNTSYVIAGCGQSVLVCSIDHELVLQQCPVVLASGVTFRIHGFRLVGHEIASGRHRWSIIVFGDHTAALITMQMVTTLPDAEFHPGGMRDAVTPSLDVVYEWPLSPHWLLDVYCLPSLPAKDLRCDSPADATEAIEATGAEETDERKAEGTDAGSKPRPQLALQVPMVLMVTAQTDVVAPHCGFRRAIKDRQTLFAAAFHPRIASKGDLSTSDRSFSSSSSLEATWLASGSCFGDLTLRTFRHGTINGKRCVVKEATSDVVVRPNAHAGSIHAIAWCPAQSSFGSHFVTVSDDRTAIVWSAPTLAPSMIFEAPQARLLAVACSDSRLWVAGEDACAREFLLHRDHDLTAATIRDPVDGKKQKVVLRCSTPVRTLVGHHGKAIWSIAAVPWNGAVCLTGGNDGGLRVWDATRYSPIREGECLHLHSATSKAKDVFALHAHLLVLRTDGTLCSFAEAYDPLTTAAGKVLAQEESWYRPVRFVPFPDRHACLLLGDMCLRNGHVVDGVSSILLQVDPLPRSGQPLVAAHFASQERLIVQKEHGEIELWRYGSEQHHLQFMTALPPLPATAGNVTACRAPTAQHLILGCDAGIFLYHLPSNQLYAFEGDLFSHQQRRPSDQKKGKERGKHAITSIELAPAAETAETLTWRCSTRSGYIVVMQFADGNVTSAARYRLEPLSSLEGLTERGLAWGFTETSFLMVAFGKDRSETGHVVAQVACGGNKRAWSTNGHTLIYVRQGSAHRVPLMEIDQVPSSVATDGWIKRPAHGREITALVAWTLSETGSASALITADVDGVLCLHSNNINDAVTRPRRIKAHRAAIKAMSFLVAIQRLVTVGIDGEAAVWRFGDEMTPLRKEAHRVFTSVSKGARYNCSALMRETYVCLGCSDGSIQLYDVATDTCRDHLRLDLGAILQIKTFRYASVQTIVVAATTRGHIVLCEVDDKNHIRLILSRRVHRSSITALGGFSSMQEAILRIWTGGDDNTLKTHHYDWQRRTFVDSSLSDAHGHCSQITDMVFDAARETLWTIGLDRRLISWHCAHHAGLKVIQQIQLLVQDPSSIILVSEDAKDPQKALYVAGVGVQKIRI